jgi:putative ABC transport system permease protein
MRETLKSVGLTISFAARGLGRRLGFSAAVILTLALGIAGVTSVASVAYGVLLAPLPIRDAARVVDLWGDNPTNQPKHFPLSGEEYRAFARESQTLSSVAAIDYQGTLPRLLQIGDTVVSIPGALVSGNFFDVVGARPVVGRLLSPDDDRYGATFAGVISERLWRTAFGADPHIVGRQTKFYLHEMTIVGVVAGNLDFPRGAELWASWPNYGGAKDTLPGFVDAIGRLAVGRSAADAKNELDAFLSRANEPHSGARRLVGRSLHAVAEPILDVIVGDVRPVLRVVVGAVVLLLLVTCGNVAGLMLVHALARRREFAVRAALGAGWRRIARQTLGESAILCAAGGTLGIACSWFAVRLFSAFAPSELPRSANVGLAIPVLAGAVLITTCVAIAFGSIPAFVGSRVSLTEALGQRRETGANPRAQRIRGMLVGAQVAAAVAVLATAGAVARGFQELSHRDLGFRPDHVIIARFGQTASVGNLAAYKIVLERALETIRHVPGVTHATGMIVTPFRSTGNDLAYSIAGDAPGEPTGRPMADYLGADTDYFNTLGITLRKGRTFNSGDDFGSAHVGVVDELLAAQAWPGKNPIGQQIGVGTSIYTVVGVVASTRYRDLLAPRATLYTSFDQTPTMLQQYVAIRTSANASAVIPALRDAVRNTDARLYLADFATMGARIDSSLMTARLSAILLVAFAIAILIVTGVGLYSVAATFVRQREFDIGLRMALGATPTEVARFVVRQVVVVVGVGAVVGLLAAVGAARIVQSITYGVSARDPSALAIAAGGVCVIAAIALAVPAGRAARANPADVLRRG